MITQMQDRTFRQYSIKPTDPSEIKKLLCKYNQLKMKKGMLYLKVLPRESQEALFQLVLPAAYRETALKGYLNDIGHLVLDRILDLKCIHFFWPQMDV